jgi:hypothetical protein
MKWLKKLLGMEVKAPEKVNPPPECPMHVPEQKKEDAGAKAFDNMAKTLSTPPAPVETVTVAPIVAPEVQDVAVKVEEAIVEAKPKAPRKPRAKKEPVKKETGWPFPGNVPAEGTTKPAVRTVKAK